MWVPIRARTASNVVVVGTTTRGTAVRLIVTTPRLTTATTTWVSALLVLCSSNSNKGLAQARPLLFVYKGVNYINGVVVVGVFTVLVFPLG